MTTEALILAQLQTGPMRVQQIVNRTALPRAMIDKACAYLKSIGQIARDEAGFYQIVEPELVL